jgi:beta-lactamase class A
MFIMQFKTIRSRFALAFITSILLAACSTVPPPRIEKPKAPITRPVVVSKPTPAPVVTRPKTTAAPEALEVQINELWRSFAGRTGVAVLAIDDNWSVSKRGEEFFPQQSVSKIWVAMTVLDQVDRGKITLDQIVRITRDDLTLFHQPIRARVVANGEINETVLSLLEQSVTTSDCTANDSLLRTIGGPEAVREFIARKGLGKIRFGPGERKLQSGIAGMEWQQGFSIGNRFETERAKLSYEVRKAALDRYLSDPVDGASPLAIVKALGELSNGSLLSQTSTRMLMALMERTSSGPNRLKAGVPADWRFGHKTGTGQQLAAISTGYNDIGIMTAPNGKRYAVAVMMGDTTASIPQRMEMMQGVSRAVAAEHR